MTIGFTGTSNGMTCEQRQEVMRLLLLFKPSIVHHGCCIGADATFHHLADVLEMHIVMHPPTDRKAIMPMPAEGLRYTILPALPYLERNHAIVDSCDMLVATPLQAYEVRRSGTWATVRYARNVVNRYFQIRVVYPNGRVEVGS